MTVAQERTQLPTIKSAHFSQFVKNPKNLRENTNRPDLLQQIKADGRILQPFITYPESFNIDEKLVTYDGNSRLDCLQKLAEDSEYTGSLEVNYFELPLDIAGDPIKEKLFMISLGTTNEQLSTMDQARGYAEVVEDYINEQIIKDSKFSTLTEAKQETKRNKFKKAAIDEICRLTGKNERTIQIALQVLEISQENKEVNAALINGVIAPRNVELLDNLATKVNQPLNQVLELANKAKNEINNATISKKVIDLVENLYQKSPDLMPKIMEHVNNDNLPIHLIDDALLVVAETQTSLDEVLDQALSFSNYKKIDSLDLQKAKVSILKDNAEITQANDFLDSTKDEIIEEPVISNIKTETEVIEQYQQYKEYVSGFSLYLESLQIESKSQNEIDFYTMQSIFKALKKVEKEAEKALAPKKKEIAKTLKTEQINETQQPKAEMSY